MSNDENNIGNNVLGIGCLIVFIVILFITASLFYPFVTDYYVSGDTIITRNRITKKLGYIEIKEEPFEIDYMLFWNYKYRETNKPCNIIVIDRYGRKAYFVRHKECIKNLENGNNDNNDPLGLFDNTTNNNRKLKKHKPKRIY